MNLNDMTDYIDYFSSLHTNTQKGIKAPHKAIMLLSVIDLVEYGVIISKQIEFSERLEQQFMHNWSRYVGQSDVFQPKAGTPFWHLNNESFWRLIPYVGGDEAIATHLQGNPYSPGTTRKLIRYAEIDNELFELLQDKTNRAKLRTILIKHYL